MSQIVVLSGNARETEHFARQENLGRVRHVTNKDTLRGMRPKLIHILPSYYERRDLAAVASGLRHVHRRARYSGGVIVEEWDRVDDRWVPARVVEADLDDELKVEPEPAPTRLEALEGMADELDETETTTNLDDAQPESNKVVSNDDGGASDDIEDFFADLDDEG